MIFGAPDVVLMLLLVCLGKDNVDSDAVSSSSLRIPLLLTSPCLVLVLVVCTRLKHSPPCRLVHRLLAHTACCVWETLTCLCCVVRLRLQEMGEQINFQEELNWGFN